MRIGILTFWKTEDNYGQLLQCYATQTYLRSLGHDTFLVKATNGHEYVPTLKGLLLDKVRTAYRLSPYPLYFLKRAIGSFFYTLTHGKGISLRRIGPEAVKSIFFLGAIKIILTEILKTALGDMSAEFAVGKGVEE